MRSAELRPELSACLLDSSSSHKQDQQPTNKKKDARPPEHSFTNIIKNPETVEIDEFGDDDFEDLEVMNAGKSTFLYRQYTKY